MGLSVIYLRFLVPLLYYPQLGACSFSLDVSGPDWNLTAPLLADTTSQACKDAYSAAVDCETTIRDLASNLRQGRAWDPTPEELARACVPACVDSLDAYVRNVRAACDQPGDSAPVYDSSDPLGPRDPAPVADVGELLQYIYSRACARNETDWCYLTYARTPPYSTDVFSCRDKCAVQFYTNAHERAGSQYASASFALTLQTDWWVGQFAKGWETVENCRAGDYDASRWPTFATTSTATRTSSTAVKGTETTSATSSDGLERPDVSETDDLGATDISSLVPGMTATFASDALSGTPSSGANRLELPLLGLW